MYQKLIIAGNLGKDPEMRYSPSGDAVTNLNVATSRKYTDKSGQQVEETIWVRVSVWGKQAEACNQYLKKGRAVLVEGRLNADKATGGPRIFTRQDGTSGASFEMTADTVRFLSSAQREGDGASAASGAQVLHDAPPTDEENIPF
ncbi:MAG: single-stranded DNA-binding protein [Chloroflexi bacterium]|nr:single-stranded DNA-binding protein [Chloroflexota bacterium]MBI5349273.1 single-stranded DNA-binding protein [Chloroflexota bacterium]MBI5713957.1 single-stranded DNA-binding protein [Chloroflexota bacterium]